MKRLPAIALLLVSALALVFGAAQPLPSITVPVPTLTAAAAAQAQASNALYTASIVRLGNQLATLATGTNGVSTNAAQRVRTTPAPGQPLPATVPHGHPASQTGVRMSPLGLSGDCVQSPSGLVSWWPAEGDASDAVGNNPGARVNGDSYDTGPVGQAFSFDQNSGQSVQFSSSLATPAFTWECG